VEEAKIDEIWSFVGKKSQQRWLCHAIDHQTGVVLAPVAGTYQDEVFLQLKAWLAPLGIHHFYTNAADVYNHHLDPQQQIIGKTQTQKTDAED
jgi:insertion element IS1 protein InsB